MIGIDDATRCPVIGSLVVAGVKADNKTLKYFKEIGVKDSKLLAKSRRFKLAKIILQKAKVEIMPLSAEIISEEIEINGEKLNLNDKEMIAYLTVYEKLKPDTRIYVDNFEHSREAFIKRARKFINNMSFSNWVIEHDADLHYTIVGAASIVAKAYSDLEMMMLNNRYGLGSGNPNDRRTVEFIKKHLNHKPKCNDGCQFIRWNWATVARLREEYEKN